MSDSKLTQLVKEELHATPFIDIHTHLFKPSLGQLGLWGIDALITYHYLEAELFRSSTLTPGAYFSLSKTEQADVIWKTLFIDNPPVSEATRGVVAVLNAFGLPTSSSDLREARRFFASRSLESHIADVFKLAGISDVVMTNDPLDPAEAPLWSRSDPNPQFHAALRLDRVLKKFPEHSGALQAKGYRVQPDLSGNSISEVRRFLDDWSEKMLPVYMACSLPDTFQYPDDNICATLLREAVLPACRDRGIPLSLMIGVRLQVNPALKLAGDASGRADLQALEHLAAQFPENRFLVSVLSRENQHELCVYARKFNNIMPFGCWWFLNNPSIVEEITRERIEMLGASFIPQHSDARVLEQVIYKWRNTRRTLAPILTRTYENLEQDGREVTRQDIQKDISRLFQRNFLDFCGLQS